MRVEKRGNRYRIQKMINGKKYSLSFDHKPGKKEIEEALRGIDTSVKIKGTFKSYASQYISIKEHVLSPTTIKSYRGLLRNISDDFKKTAIKDMTAAIVQSEINKISMRKSPKSTTNNNGFISPKTVAEYHGFISAVLGMYRPDLMLHTTLPARIKYTPHVPSDDEIKAILDASKGTRYELAFRLGIYALRRSEVCAVTAADLDGNMLTINKSLIEGEDGYVTREKNKTEESSRTIYVDDCVAGLLRKQGVGFAGLLTLSLKLCTSTRSSLALILSAFMTCATIMLRWLTHSASRTATSWPPVAGRPTMCSSLYTGMLKKTRKRT